MLSSKPYQNFQHWLLRLFPRGSLFKATLLKLFLNQQEKQFFYLIAPADSVRTHNPPGYLYNRGWWEGLDSELLTNAEGEYIPWLTYPFVDFLTPRLHSAMHLLEYGSGSSTLFWAERFSKVTAIEHDQGWYQNLLDLIPANVSLIYQPLVPLADYLTPATIQQQTYDIILIDGRQRVACCEAAIPKLKSDGIIILDDSQRSRYLTGVEYLHAQGFKSLPFWGLRHRAHTNTCTTIFYRNDNCLGL